MYEYYFKIKKGDIEFECSTTDKTTFEEQLSDWINGIVQGSYVAPPKNEEPVSEMSEPKDFEEKPQRSGFINVKNLSSINEMQTPEFDLSNIQENDFSINENFESALNDSMQNPKTDIVEKQDSVSDFEEYTRQFSPESGIDNLIVAAMFISNVENQERFTIKQINAKLVPVVGNPVDHGVIQEAIEQGYVRIIPDLTETSEFTEYTLTEAGEGYFVV